MNRYNYKQPRRFNVVSVLILLGGIGGAYAAWKFVPPYWNAYKVDGVLSDVAYRASDLRDSAPGKRDSTAVTFATQARDDIEALGIDPAMLDVYFTPDYGEIHADYRVVVKHPGGHRTTLSFRRKGKVPRR